MLVRLQLGQRALLIARQVPMQPRQPFQWPVKALAGPVLVLAMRQVLLVQLPGLQLLHLHAIRLHILLGPNVSTAYKLEPPLRLWEGFVIATPRAYPDLARLMAFVALEIHRIHRQLLLGHRAALTV
jgi:hypothetical protein